MKHILFLALTGFLLLNSCLGIDTDSISDQFNYTPNVSIPIGTSLVQYNSVGDLPISTPPSDEPVSFTASEILFFDLLKTFEDLKYIQNVTLHFNTINQYPAEVSIKLTYYSTNGEPIDLTANQPINIPAAEIDDAGKIIKYSSNITDIDLSPEAIEGLSKVGELKVITSVNNLLLSPPIIDNLSNYFIKTSIGVRVQLLIDNK